MAAKQADHFVRFALAHEPVVDEHAGELVADRLVDQHRRDRGIDAARQAADHARLADLRADAGDLLVAEGGHRPVALEAGDLEQEIGEELRAVGRVDHLRMEHRRVVAARFVGGDRVGRVLRHRIDPETLGQAGHAVAVAHPHRIAAARSPHAVEQGARLRGSRHPPGRIPPRGRPRPCRRAARTRSAGRSRWRGSERRLRRFPPARAGFPLREPTPGRRTGSPPWASAARRLRPPSRTGGFRNRRPPRAHAGRSAA